MRLKSFALATFALALLASPLHAFGWWWSNGVQGNDVGGIISWSPEVQLVFQDIAAAHCAHWNKVAVITSVHPWYGDYIGFTCQFPSGYDPAKGIYYGTPLRARY
jgi:hypothetical protein